MQIRFADRCHRLRRRGLSAVRYLGRYVAELEQYARVSLYHRTRGMTVLRMTIQLLSGSSRASAR